MIRIRVLAFARLRELLGHPDCTLELPEGTRARDAWQQLVREHGALAREEPSLRCAVNGTLAPFEQTLMDGDELALLPPVGGG